MPITPPTGSLFHADQHARQERLAKEFETLIASSTAMLYLAATRLLTRRLATH